MFGSSARIQEKTGIDNAVTNGLPFIFQPNDIVVIAARKAPLREAVAFKLTLRKCIHGL